MNLTADSSRYTDGNFREENNLDFIQDLHSLGFIRVIRVIRGSLPFSRKPWIELF